MISELLSLSNRNKVIVNPLCRAIKEFGVIYSEDMDAAKRIAPKELMLVALVSDYRSVYSFYSDKEKFDEVKKAVGLPNDWKPRLSIHQAITRYKEMQESPSIRELIGLQRAVMLSSKFISSINDRLEAAIDDESEYLSLMESEESEEKIKEFEKKRRTNHDNVLSNVNTIVDMVQKLNTSMTLLSQIEEKVRKEESNKEEKDKGGGKRGPKEMPEDSLFKK